MNLWTLLILVSSAAFFGSALAAARITSGDARSSILAGISGVLLAVCNAWIWDKLGAMVDAHVKGFSELGRERYLRALYLAAAVWVLCAGFLGSFISSAIIRLAVMSLSLRLQVGVTRSV